MKFKKNIPNLIRSKLISFINTEILEKFKKKQQIRLNSKKIIDIYNNYNKNCEIYLQNKIIRSNLKVYDYSNRKLKRNSLIFFPLEDLNDIEKEKDLKYLHLIQNKKVLFSQKKLKTVNLKKSNTLESTDKVSFNKMQDSLKENLLKLRKISNDIINTKIILEKFKQNNSINDNNNNNENNDKDNNNNDNSEKNKTLRKSKRKKMKNLTFNLEKDFKINLNICKKLGNNELFENENYNSFAYRNNNNCLENNNNYYEKDNSKNSESNFRRKKKIHSCINHNDQYIKKYLGESLNNLEVQ